MTKVMIGQLVADAWDHMLSVSEDPFKRHPYESPLAELFGISRGTYRAWLHRKIINAYGQEVPRIAIVRENLRRLGNIRLNPARIP